MESPSGTDGCEEDEHEDLNRTMAADLNQAPSRSQEKDELQLLFPPKSDRSLLKHQPTSHGGGGAREPHGLNV